MLSSLLALSLFQTDSVFISKLSKFVQSDFPPLLILIPLFLFSFFVSIAVGYIRKHSDLLLIPQSSINQIMAAAALLESNQQISICHRHPHVPVTGFCASCLRERLAGLETLETTTAVASTNRNANNIIKSLFSSRQYHHSSSSSSLRPDLRRCQSFSVAARRSFSASTASEPKRRSCDVRERNTLGSLFNLENGSGATDIPMPVMSSTSSIINAAGVDDHVFSDENDAEDVRDVIEEDDDEIVPVEEEEENNGDEMIKSIKQHMSDVKKTSPKDLKERAGSFWVAASVFRKKLQKWRSKQKMKKQKQQQQNHRSRHAEDLSSEMDSDVLGRRRSCDFPNPRYSLDGGRMSFEDPRGSWDQPRASWDGYLTGGRSVFSSRSVPAPVQVVEEDANTIQRYDGLIPVEDDMVFPSNTMREHSMEYSSERDHSNSNSFRRDCTFNSSIEGGQRTKSKKWSKAWNIWGFIQRKSSNGRNGGGGNGAERSLSDYYSSKSVRRSQSSLSSRYSTNNNGMKRRDEMSCDRNHSGRYSPKRNILDEEMLNLFLGPLRTSRRVSVDAPNSFTGSIMHLY